MTKRLKAEERRESILAVAKVLFADKGYNGVSVDELAKRVGVSPAVLYQHFSSKEAIYEAALSAIACEREDYVEAIVSGESDFASVLLRMTRIYTSSVAQDPDYLRMEMMSVLEGAQAAKQFFENRWRTFTDFIEYSVQELRSQAKVGEINPKIASLMFQGMIREALYEKCIVNSPRYRSLDLEVLVDQLIYMFLRSIGYVIEKA